MDQFMPEDAKPYQKAFPHRTMPRKKHSQSEMFTHLPRGSEKRLEQGFESVDKQYMSLRDVERNKKLKQLNQNDSRFEFLHFAMGKFKDGASWVLQKLLNSDAERNSRRASLKSHRMKAALPRRTYGTRISQAGEFENGFIDMETGQVADMHPKIVEQQKFVEKMYLENQNKPSNYLNQSAPVTVRDKPYYNWGEEAKLSNILDSNLNGVPGIQVSFYNDFPNLKNPNNFVGKNELKGVRKMLNYQILQYEGKLNLISQSRLSQLLAEKLEDCAKPVAQQSRANGFTLNKNQAKKLEFQQNEVEKCRIMESLNNLSEVLGNRKSSQLLQKKKRVFGPENPEVYKRRTQNAIFMRRILQNSKDEVYEPNMITRALREDFNQGLKRTIPNFEDTLANAQSLTEKEEKEYEKIKNTKKLQPLKNSNFFTTAGSSGGGLSKSRNSYGLKSTYPEEKMEIIDPEEFHQKLRETKELERKNLAQMEKVKKARSNEFETVSDSAESKLQSDDAMTFGFRSELHSLQARELNSKESKLALGGQNRSIASSKSKQGQESGEESKANSGEKTSEKSKKKDKFNSKEAHRGNGLHGQIPVIKEEEKESSSFGLSSNENSNQFWQKSGEKGVVVSPPKETIREEKENESEDSESGQSKNKGGRIENFFGKKNKSKSDSLHLKKDEKKGKSANPFVNVFNNAPNSKRPPVQSQPVEGSSELNLLEAKSEEREGSENEKDGGNGEGQPVVTVDKKVIEIPSAEINEKDIKKEKSQQNPQTEQPSTGLFSNFTRTEKSEKNSKNSENSEKNEKKDKPVPSFFSQTEISDKSKVPTPQNTQSNPQKVEKQNNQPNPPIEKQKKVNPFLIGVSDKTNPQNTSSPSFNIGASFFNKSSPNNNSNVNYFANKPQNDNLNQQRNAFTKNGMNFFGRNSSNSTQNAQNGESSSVNPFNGYRNSSDEQGRTNFLNNQQTKKRSPLDELISKSGNSFFNQSNNNNTNRDNPFGGRFGGRRTNDNPSNTNNNNGFFSGNSNRGSYRNSNNDNEGRGFGFGRGRDNSRNNSQNLNSGNGNSFFNGSSSTSNGFGGRGNRQASSSSGYNFGNSDRNRGLGRSNWNGNSNRDRNRDGGRDAGRLFGPTSRDESRSRGNIFGNSINDRNPSSSNPFMGALNRSNNTAASIFEDNDRPRPRKIKRILKPRQSW